MPENQIASSVWMIRPAKFFSNPETASSNFFQQTDISDHTSQAHIEFDNVADSLKKAGVEVIVTRSANLNTPDAIFPNNWISFHPDGEVILYPMQSLSRREERKIGIPPEIAEKFIIGKYTDLSAREEHSIFLEGTGSIVFDHFARKAYACISERTDEELFREVCSFLRYLPLAFHAVDMNNHPVYHTNVVMCIGKSFTVLCSDAIRDVTERRHIIDSLENDGKEILPVSQAQMHAFAGNMLQLKSKNGESLIVLSGTAHRALTTDQLNKLSKHGKLLQVDVPVIEKYGGGSIRCMLAEIFLKNKNDAV